jgi:hypothetical protein
MIKRPSLSTTVLAVSIVAALMFVAVVLVAQVRPPRRHLPVAGMPELPSPGPTIVSDGTPEADATLRRLYKLLEEDGCQLGVEVRLAGDGTLEPRIRVEWVQHCMVYPPLPERP